MFHVQSVMCPVPRHKPRCLTHHARRFDHIEHGFTLVELLVVVAILALLIAILLPSLNKARQQAVSLKCLPNLRTVMSAAYLYGGDNNNTMVAADWENSASPSPQSVGYPVWVWAAFSSDMILLGQYTDPGPMVFDYTRPMWGRVMSKKSPWFCPEKIINPAAGESETLLIASYALNLDVFPYLRANDAQHPTGWEYSWKMERARSPARLMAFVDSTIERFSPGPAFYGNPGGNGDWFPAGTPGAYYNHAIRHPNNTTNLSFLDGHVQNVANSDDGVGNLTLGPALNAGVFVVKTTD